MDKSKNNEKKKEGNIISSGFFNVWAQDTVKIWAPLWRMAIALYLADNDRGSSLEFTWI